MPTPPPPGNPTRQQLDELDALLQRMLALPLSQLDEGLAPTTPEPAAAAPRVAAVRAVAPAAVAPPPVRPTLAGSALEARLAAPPPPRPPEPTPAEAPWRADLPSVPTLTPPPGSSSVFAAWGVSGLTIEPIRPGTSPEPPRQTRRRPVPAPPPPLENYTVPLRVAPPTEPAPTLRIEEISPPAPPPPTAPRPTATAPIPVPAPAAPIPAPIPPPYIAPVPLWLKPLDWANQLGFGLAALTLGPPGRWLGSPAGRNLLGGTGLLCLAAAVAWGVADYLGWSW